MGGKWIIFKDRDYVGPDGDSVKAFMVKDIQYRQYRNIVGTFEHFVGGFYPDYEFANEDDPREYGRNWSLPFISAPTGNTDQIVLEWVQDEHEPEFVEAFTKKLLEII